MRQPAAVTPNFVGRLSHFVMAALVAAIHVFGPVSKVVDGRALPHRHQDKLGTGRNSPNTSWPGWSGPPEPARAATGGPDKPGHDVGEGNNLLPPSRYPDAYGARPGHDVEKAPVVNTIFNRPALGRARA